jgi:DNA (cytosine-5)-methyltransferase 1
VADGSQQFAVADPCADLPAIVNLFAGWGGTSLAIEHALGRHPDAAMNHWEIALGVHKRNWPDAEHYQADCLETDPRIVCPGRRIGLLWLSPDCRHFSPAKGSAIVSKRIRALAWAAIPWLKLRRPDVMILENVEAFLTWGPTIIGEDGKERPDKAREGQTFDRWCRRVRQAGATALEWRVEAVADHGGRTIRRRLKVIARFDGKPIVWPEATHAVRAKAKAKGLQPHRPAYECIDFTRRCPSIFMTQAQAKAEGLNIKRPLEEATLSRIAKGLFRHTIANAEPFAVHVTHHGGDRSHSLADGLPTVTGAHRGELALVAPHLAVFRGASDGRDLRDAMPTNTANSFVKRPGGAAPLGLVAAHLEEMNSASAGRALTEGGPTLTGCGHHGLVAAFMEQANTGMIGHDMRESVSTIVAKGCTQRVIAAQLTHLRGSNTGGGEGDLREALRASTAGGTHQALLEATLAEDLAMATPFSPYADELRAFLIKYYGSATAVDLRAPLDTATSRARFGLVMVSGVAYRITDIGMRMLDPETELAAAMGVPMNGPRKYVLGWTADGRRVSKTNITKLIGNGVAREWAERLVAANCSHLAAPGFTYREAA